MEDNVGKAFAEPIPICTHSGQRLLTCPKMYDPIAKSVDCARRRDLNFSTHGTLQGVARCQQVARKRMLKNND